MPGVGTGSLRPDPRCQESVVTRHELRTLYRLLCSSPLLAALCLACTTTPSGSMPAASNSKAGDLPISIAVVPFGLAAGTAPPPCDVAEIIRGDLEAVGPIEILPIAELPAHPTRLSQVEFATWRSFGVDYLVVGLVAGVHDGGDEVEFRLIDPRDESTLVGYLMPSAPDALQDTAHRIAELIEETVVVPTSVTDSSHPAGEAHRSPSSIPHPAPTIPRAANGSSGTFELRGRPRSPDHV